MTSPSRTTTTTVPTMLRPVMARWIAWSTRAHSSYSAALMPARAPNLGTEAMRAAPPAMLAETKRRRDGPALLTDMSPPLRGALDPWQTHLAPFDFACHTRTIGEGGSNRWERDFFVRPSALGQQLDSSPEFGVLAVSVMIPA